jgi:hypothetical protein
MIGYCLIPIRTLYRFKNNSGRDIVINVLYVGLVLHCLIFLCSCNRIRNFSTDSCKIFQYKYSWKCFQWEQSCSMRKHTDSSDRTDLAVFSGRTKLFFFASLQVRLSIVETRRVRHRGNRVFQEWKEIMDARKSFCKFSDTLCPVYAKIRIFWQEFIKNPK